MPLLWLPDTSGKVGLPGSLIWFADKTRGFQGSQCRPDMGVLFFFRFRVFYIRQRL
jgi:hypothetical protein